MTTFCPIMTGIHGPSSNPLLRTSGTPLAASFAHPRTPPSRAWDSSWLHEGPHNFPSHGHMGSYSPQEVQCSPTGRCLPDWNAVVAWLPALPPSDRHKSTSTSLVQRRRFVSLILKPQHRMGTTYGTHHLIKISVLVVTRAKPGFWCCDAWNPKKYSHVFFLLIISPSTVFDHCSLAARSRQNNNPPVLPQI